MHACRMHALGEPCVSRTHHGSKKRPCIEEPSDRMICTTGKRKRCLKFFSTSGCPYGEACRFLHYVSGRTYRDVMAGSIESESSCSSSSSSSSSSSYAFCELPNNTLSTSLYYGEPSPPGVSVGAASIGTRPAAGDFLPIKARIRIQASMAGAVIGRAGGNVRQISRMTGARLSVREHTADASMRDIIVEGHLPEQVGQAQEMIKRVLMRASCSSSLSYSSALLLSSSSIFRSSPHVSSTTALQQHCKLIPPPPRNFKTRLCMNFSSEGGCSFAENCHFAHGASELRSVTSLMTCNNVSHSSCFSSVTNCIST